MSSSFCWQLNALIRKNILILKRNKGQTIVELIFPIFLMIILVSVRQAFLGEDKKFSKEEKDDDNFFLTRSSAFVDKELLNTSWNNFKSSEAFQNYTEILYNSSQALQNDPTDSNTLNALLTDLYNHGLELPKVYNSSEYMNWNKFLKIRQIFGVCTTTEFNRTIVFLLGSEKERLKAILEEYYEFESEYYQLLLKSKTSPSDWKYKSSITFETKWEKYEQIKNYLSSQNYQKDDHIEKICMGITLDKNDETSEYDFRLHYFDLGGSSKGVSDVPSLLSEPYDYFQQGPDIDSYEKFKYNGYNYIFKIVYEYVVQNELNKNITINYSLMLQKYNDYILDMFSQFVGYIVPSFTMIAYLCPLCLFVFRMVSEKETRAKEGMKIMGMGEGVYFLSYLIQFFIFNLFHAILNGLVIHIMFEHIPFIWLFLVFLLFGLDVFSMAFLFQSFIDKTRVALILSILLYYVTSFLYIAIYDDNVKLSSKVGCSIFPTVAIEVGLIVLAKFQAGLKDFKASDVNKIYANFRVRDMYLMFVADFFIYLFIGYYLQNIISHDFGISRPFYFLCTKGYWCKNSKKEKTNKILDEEKEMQDNNKSLYGKNKNFQDEEIYKNRDPKDILKIRDLVKVFGDNKRAVDKLNLNLYKDEIFALLGHNGSGKTTTLSMLSGLYEATSGEAYFNGENILDDESMERFRTILGICPQHDVLFEDLTVLEHLQMFCYFKGFPSEKIDDEVLKTMRDFRIYDIRDIVAKNLSAGQRRKLSISISIIGGSKVIFLDEPSSGMDITSRRNLWEILKRISDDKIIVLTTHYMEEASVLGKRIGIIADGRLKCLGTPLFLIERFGKFMSVNVTKDDGANDENIINFFKERVSDVEYEKLSEEILFRIPKGSNGANQDNKSENNEKLQLSENSNKLEDITEELKTEQKQKLDYKKFFDDLDNNKTDLKIKSYTAAMPTLEDVFLNVASSDLQKVDGKKQTFTNIGNANDKILFEDDNFGNYSSNRKFALDLGITLRKRLYQVLRDLRTFILEILCPIVLVLLGLCVCEVNFVDDSDPLVPNLNDVFETNDVYYGSYNQLNITDYCVDDGNTKASYLPTDTTYSDVYLGIKDFYLKVHSKNNEKCYGAFYMINNTNNKYEFVEFLNATFRMGNAFFTPKFLNQILQNEIDPSINIKFTHQALPISPDVKEVINESKNNMLALFACIAFSLIPANFVTLIVKERINNSKHLMKVSGITLVSYWMSNYIFELVKYYIEGGIILLIVWLFDYFPDYFWLLYILYGPAMVSFTYLISFAFESESGSQNGLILLNLLFGALCTTICLSLRMNEGTSEVGKGLAYLFRLLPSFSMGFGFSILLNSVSFLYLELPLEKFLKAKNSEILTVKFVGSDLVYLAAETIVYLLLLIIIEYKSYGSKRIPSNQIEFKQQEDENVENEKKRAQEEMTLIKNDYIKEDNDNSNKEIIKNYAVRIKNLKKIYTRCGCCGSIPVKEAVKDISFCVEYGECFGMLGLNGAGKTSIFKAITQEHHQTHGGIYIDGVDTSTRFEDIHDMFGYCPQYDAIFEYMTVYENLEFYARIKGIALEKLNKMINAFIDEMSLTQYTNKIGGNLSGGNKRKLSVAISMIANPPIILLDEPSTGMDPEARRFMWAIIHKISTKRKKNCVIMTTHAMDEAETLCRRMAIMVNGEFVCLGSSQEIKDKYGYGYEIDVRIKPFNEKQFEEMIKDKDIPPNIEINENNVEEILTKLNKKLYFEELHKERIGRKLLKEIQTVGKINLYILCSWIHYTNCALKSIKDIIEYFEEIYLTEFIDNNFLFKIKKTPESKSIGYLFGIIETKREECHITEYSIQPTSLEQIFNMFASKQDQNAVSDGENKNKIEEQYTKIEIAINKELLDKLIY